MFRCFRGSSQDLGKEKNKVMVEPGSLPDVNYLVFVAS